MTNSSEAQFPASHTLSVLKHAMANNSSLHLHIVKEYVSIFLTHLMYLPEKLKSNCFETIHSYIYNIFLLKIAIKLKFFSQFIQK